MLCAKWPDHRHRRGQQKYSKGLERAGPRLGEYGIVQEMATAASAVVLQTPYTQLAANQ
jgi:hypothetical protein